MRLSDFLDKGASLDPGAPCLTMAGETRTYEGVQRLSWRIGRALARSGIRPGDKVAVLSGNDPVAFASVFGVSRAGAVWCPVNPRGGAAENRDLLGLLDCRCLLYARSFAELVGDIAPDLPGLEVLVCLDELDDWLSGSGCEPFAASPDDDVVLIAGTGGTTGTPKGVMLTGHNIEAMTALTLMSYPFQGRPVYLALAPLTHAAGVLCFPVLSLGGEIVVMPAPDLGEFLALAERRTVTHAFLPPTVIYRLLDHPDLPAADLSALQCLWYGAAPMSAARLEEAITAIGPVMGQLFGQTEAPMMVSTLAPADHFRPDGTLATERLSSAGRPTPLTTVAIMDPDGADGALLPRGQRGEIVIRGPLVMAGYYKNEDATAEASRHGWHHTGDIGYLDDDGYLFVVDRLKDMIITGGFNVYSAEVEQALLAHPAVLDCAVIGLPDDTWGERVTAVVQPHPGQSPGADDLRAFVKGRLGGVKAPKQVEIWPDLPRSRVGKVLKNEVRSSLLGGDAAGPLQPVAPAEDDIEDHAGDHHDPYRDRESDVGAESRVGDVHAVEPGDERGHRDDGGPAGDLLADHVHPVALDGEVRLQDGRDQVA
jgi:acyl-CoA synthetase (AMP-forming)/AMP-acid ligase II